MATCIGSSAGFAATLPDAPDDSYVTDGTVNAFVRVGDTLYIGGAFDRVGPRTGPGVELALDGSQNSGLPQISGSGPISPLAFSGSPALNAVVSDGAGGWYIGGCFSHVGGLARTNLAHILADHSVDPGFAPTLDGIVDALAVSSGTVYVAGLFATVDGQPRGNLAALDASGSVTAFNPNADGEIIALVVSGDGAIVYVGGRGFTMVGGQPRVSIAALNAADGSATATFNPSPTSSAGAGNVTTLALSGSTLYVGGTFAMIGGATRNSLAALSLGGADDGVAVAGFDAAASFFGCAACADIAALAVSGSTLYVGGSFDTIGGESRANLAALDAAVGTATAFDPAPDANILSLSLSLSTSGSIVYVSGGFRTIGGQPRNFVAALNADGTANGFDPEPNNSVSAIGTSASAVYLAGPFSSIGGVTRNSLAAINLLDGTATAWDPDGQGLNGGLPTINAMGVAGSTLYVGGFFTQMGGEARASLAAFGLGDGSVAAWNPGTDGIPKAFAFSDVSVYVGGALTMLGGQTRLTIGEINLSDGSITSFDPQTDLEVDALALVGPLLYVGGSFSHLGTDNAEREGLGAVNRADGSATDWNPHYGDPFNAIYALQPAGSTIYVGGFFSSMHGEPRNNLAEVNTGDDGTVTDWDPNPRNAVDANDYVNAIAVDGATVYVGGYFNAIGGQPRSMLAALNASDGSATAFNPNASGGNAVFALALDADGTLYAGGSFNTFDLGYQQSFSRFTPLVPNDVIFANGFDGR